MISTPPSIVPAISAVASLRATSRLWTRRVLVVLCAILAVLFGNKAGTASAQTAHFSGAQSLSVVASGFNTPAGVTLDSSGNIYVADALNNVVREILAVNGSIPASPTMVTLGSGFKSPIAIALDGSGNVYVADYGNYAVKEILAVNGSIPASPTIRTLATVQFPSGIAVDSNGNVFVSAGCITSSLGMTSNVASASTGSCGPLEELQAVNGSIPASPVITPFSGFTTPAGLAFDTNGNLYVADQGSNSVKEILAVNGSVSTSSTIRTVASFTGTTGPTGAAVDSSGNVYVAYPSNNAVYEVLAVNGSIPASPTIVSVGSGFKSPLGVAVDKNGTVYVADALNNRVVKMSLSIADFGAVNIGTTSTAIPMLFTFDTAGTLGSTAVLTQGATGLDFANAGTGSCKANTAYAAGQSCTVDVKFTPKFAGTRNGTTVLYNTAGITIATGSVQGTGLGPQIDFYPGTASTVAAIADPQGLAIDNSGNIYASNANGIYQMQAVNGSVPASPSIRTITATGGSYYSVAFDASGNLYTAGYPGNSVIKVEAVNGTIPASPSIVTITNSFNNPQYITVDHSGNVYVADSVNSAVKEILAVNGSIPDSPSIVTLATEPGYAIGPLAVDGNGNVFFAYSHSLMEIVAVNGSIPASPVVRALATNGGFNGIAVDASGNVYVLNASSGEVQEILAVSGSVPASPYIFPLAEGFIGAEGLVVDASGNVYISDTSNNRVVKLNPSTPPSLAFAPTAVGATSMDSPQLVALTNVGNAQLTFPIPSMGNNPSIGTNFSLGGSSTCPVLSPSSYQQGLLAPGYSCLIQVSFTPATTGALSSTLALTDNNLNAASPGYATQSIKLSGTGLQPAPNFTLMVSSPVTVTQGAASTTIIRVIPGSGFTGTVSLAVNGLPSGVTASFSPNPTAGTSTLTLTASNSAALGTVIVVINGTAGTQTVSTSLQLAVVALPPSFSLVPDSSSLTVNQGSSGTSTITVAGRNGFSDSVNLAASGLPDGVIASFSPNPTTGTSVLTFAASNAAITGQVYVTVTGTSGALTGTNGIYLTIAPPPGFAPSSANLGTVNIGTASTTQTLTYNFGANVTLGSTAVLTQGAAGLDFTDASTGTCTANTAYAAGQSCTVNVTFTPKFAGTRNGAVVLNDNNGNVIATAYLQGTGIGPQVNFLPVSVPTGNQGKLGGGFSNPYGTAVDGSGNVYVADNRNNAVKKIPLGCTSASCVTTLGGGFNSPAYTALDGSGNVYVTDSNNNAVKEIPPGCASASCVATLGGGFSYPAGVAVDGSGNVYVTDHSNNAVKKIPPGCASASCVATLGGGFIYPEGVAVDGSGNVYVLDSSNSPVKKIPPGCASASCVTTLDGLFNSPAGVAVDGNGNVYIADFFGAAVQEKSANCSSASCVTTLFGGSYPEGVAVDGSGNVYVTDNGNNAVMKIDRVTAPSLSFPSTQVNATSATQTVTITNGGNAPLNFTNITYPANFQKSTSATSDCITTTSLESNETCTLTIDFTPAAAGILSGSLVLTDNNLNAAAPGYAIQSITLNGTGAQATPTINWAAPAAITYGTPLSATQLNATATVTGTFTYSPAAGTVLTVGQQTLTATFTPTDTADYTAASASVPLTVNQATPAITWATPAPITYGTPLSATQLSASSTVAGTFTYSPAAGTVLTAGQQTLTATFTPTDPADYTAATATVTLSVNQAAPAVTWATPAGITYGTPLSATQLSASSTVAGTFTYSPAAGTVLTAGQQTLTVTFAPTDTTDYTTAMASVTLTVNKAAPTITWATPTPITYGAALSATQLNASSAVAGTFAYSPAAGKVLTAGQQTLTATFTPTNSANYTTASATVALTVNKATPAITWATPAAITYGTALSATQLNAKASVPGTLVYSPAAGTVPAVGTDTLTVTFTPTDTTDYTTATGTVQLKVNPAPSFTLGASPASLSVAQGASGKSTFTVNKLNGFTGNVTLAASGLPTGVTAAFATNPTSGSSVLTLTASSTAATGSTAVTIKGTSGSLTASTNIALTVSCTPTTIIPYISINGGSTWTQESSATVNSPSAVVDLGPQPTSGGSWSWTGPNKYTSTSRQINSIPLTVGTDLYVATYTNTSGCKSTQTFTITVK
jgi:sugar lactone lactonase YvrE